MAGKETQLLHLKYLENFIDDYINNENRRKSMLRELEFYKKSQDAEIQEIAKQLSAIYNEFFNYTSNLRPVTPEKRESVKKLIEAKREKVSREPEVVASVSSAPSSRTNPVVTSRKTSAPTVEAKAQLPVVMSEDARKEIVNPHRVARVKQLNKTIASVDEYIKKLEKSNKNIAKRAYKGARKTALSFIGKKHISKLEAAKQLSIELRNIKKATENIDPVLNTAQITDHIQKSLQHAKSLNKDLNPVIEEASRPYQFQARNMGDKAFDELVQYLNDNYDKGSTVFGGMVPEVAKREKFVKDPFSMQTPPDGYDGPRSQMYNQELKLGDLFAIYYPLATSAKRDQLLIDTVDTFLEKNQSHELMNIYLLFKQLNALRQNVEDLTKDIAENKGKDYISGRLENNDILYNSVCKTADTINNPEMKKIVYSLEKLKDSIVAQLPKEYQPQVEKAPSAKK
ncbi:MAG: hypothetical protein JSR17_03545 [Proteobacteria bacterium]|nr:hypothetical protein [Pseudomonadota bacterium]